MVFFPEERDESFHMGKHAMERVEGMVSEAFIITGNAKIVANLEDVEDAHDGIRYIVAKKVEGLFKNTADYSVKFYNDLTDIDVKAMFPKFPGFLETKKYVDFKNNELIQKLPEFKFWKNSIALPGPLSLKGKIVKGF